MKSALRVLYFSESNPRAAFDDKFLLLQQQQQQLNLNYYLADTGFFWRVSS
jgi:hypothetical protein